MWKSEWEWILKFNSCLWPWYRMESLSACVRQHRQLNYWLIGWLIDSLLVRCAIAKFKFKLQGACRKCIFVSKRKRTSYVITVRLFASCDLIPSLKWDYFDGFNWAPAESREFGAVGGLYRSLGDYEPDRQRREYCSSVAGRRRRRQNKWHRILRSSPSGGQQCYILYGRRTGQLNIAEL